MKLNENNLLTTLTRLGGWFLIGFGLCLFFSPISIIISYFPLLGGFLSEVTSFIFGVVVDISHYIDFKKSFMIGTVITIITIAIAWIWFRPLIGLALLGLGIAISGLLYFYVKTHP